MASGPITTWQIEGEKVEAVTDFLLLAPKSLRMVTEAMKSEDDCSGQESNDKPRRVLKSRDITLPTEVHIVKAMVFPVVMYGCETCTIKKAECQMNTCLWTVVLEKTPESPLDSKGIKPVNLNGDQPEYSLEGLMLKLNLQYSGHLMQTEDSLVKSLMLGKIEGRRRGHQKMRWVDSTTYAMNMNLGKLWEMVRDMEAWCAAVPGAAESGTTGWLNNNITFLQTFFSVLSLPLLLSELQWHLYFACSSSSIIHSYLFLFSVYLIQDSFYSYKVKFTNHSAMLIMLLIPSSVFISYIQGLISRCLIGSS